MHRMLARAALRAALLCALAAGALLLSAHGGTPAPRAAEAPQAPPGGVITVAPGTSVGPAAGGDSDYVLRTEGPYVDPATRIVTGTLLLTGLILTALGAVGRREPAPGPAAAPAFPEPVEWRADGAVDAGRATGGTALNSGPTPSARHADGRWPTPGLPWPPGPPRGPHDGGGGDADHPPASPRG